MIKQLAFLAMSLSVAALASPRHDDRGCDRKDHRGPYLQSRGHHEPERSRVEKVRIHREVDRHPPRRTVVVVHKHERREPVRVVEVVRERPRVVATPRARIVLSWP